MRMKCFRILPEICARTICSVPSSCTLKKAFGSLSMTTPSAGIRSSLDKCVSPIYWSKTKPRTFERDPLKTSHTRLRARCPRSQARFFKRERMKTLRVVISRVSDEKSVGQHCCHVLRTQRSWQSPALPAVHRQRPATLSVRPSVPSVVQ